MFVFGCGEVTGATGSAFFVGKFAQHVYSYCKCIDICRKVNSTNSIAKDTVDMYLFFKYLKHNFTRSIPLNLILLWRASCDKNLRVWQWCRDNSLIKVFLVMLKVL